MTTASALDLMKIIGKLQKKTEDQKEMDRAEKESLNSKREFIDTFLTSYFGNQEFFDLFHSLRMHRIGENGNNFVSGYVKTEGYQALCFKADDKRNPGYLLLKQTEDDNAHLYINHSIGKVEPLDLESDSLMGASEFYKVGAEYLTPNVTSAMDRREEERFNR